LTELKSGPEYYWIRL